MNLYFKLGSRIRIKFDEEEQTFIHRAEQILTFDEAVKLAEDLLARAKLKKELEDEEQETLTIAIKAEEGEDADEYEYEYEYDEDGEESEGDESQDDEQNEKRKDASGESAGGKLGGNSRNSLEKATTDQSMSERMEELLDPKLANRKFEYIHFPKDVTYEEFTVGYKTLLKTIESDIVKGDSAAINGYRNTLLNKFRSENNSAINYMVKEFERKKAAISYIRSKQAKTGIIDTNKLHSYKFNDDIFKRLNIEPTGKNHGVVAVLDMSGSMSGNYRGAMDQLICLAMFCRRVGIPHRLYGFTQCGQRFSIDNKDRNKAKYEKLSTIQRRMTGKSFVFPDLGFDLIEFFHEGMSLKEFNTMVGTLIMSSKLIEMDPDDMIEGKYARHWIMEKLNTNNSWESPFQYLGLGGTPLNDAILVSRDLMAKFRKEKNIQIMNFVCITDGESNHSCYQHAYGSTHQNTTISYGNSKNTGIFVDEESRLQTSMKFNNSHEVTGMLSRTVRQSQNANFVGFYIVGGSYDVRHVANRYMSYLEGLEFQEKWRKTKNAVIPNMISFDEFYIINGGKNLRAQQASFDEVNSEMKKGQLARAFISAQNKRGASRTILGKFIEKIAA